MSEAGLPKKPTTAGLGTALRRIFTCSLQRPCTWPRRNQAFGWKESGRNAEIRITIFSNVSPLGAGVGIAEKIRHQTGPRHRPSVGDQLSSYGHLPRLCTFLLVLFSIPGLRNVISSQRLLSSQGNWIKSAIGSWPGPFRLFLNAARGCWAAPIEASRRDPRSRSSGGADRTKRKPVFCRLGPCLSTSRDWKEN